MRPGPVQGARRSGRPAPAAPPPAPPLAGAVPLPGAAAAAATVGLCLAAALAGGGCSAPQSGQGQSVLLLGFERAPDGQAPEHLRLTWAGEGTVFAEDRRVPESGSLPPAVILGTYRIVLRAPGGWRTVVARGMVGDRVVSEGGVRVFVREGEQAEAVLVLVEGRLRDDDGDGVPNIADNCPTEPNRGQSRCADERPDGGPADRRPLPDGGGPPDGRPAPDAGSERGAVPDGTAEPDAGRPVDEKLPRGRPCMNHEACLSGSCVGGRVGKFCATPEMVVVPAGPFTRGCDGTTNCSSDERPARQISLKGFEIDRTEVTHAAYERCVAAGACAVPAGFNPRGRPRHPVGNITPALAEAFCRWADKRLPTEAEWEKAARGPDDTRLYPWGDEPPNCSRAQYRDCGLGDSVPVAALGGTSSYGAEDMAGNVWEWVSDWYDAGYYGRSPDTDPGGPASGTTRVRRGGAYTSEPSLLRVSSRQTGESATGASMGLRCARDL